MGANIFAQTCQEQLLKQNTIVIFLSPITRVPSKSSGVVYWNIISQQIHTNLKVLSIHTSQKKLKQYLADEASFWICYRIITDLNLESISEFFDWTSQGFFGK